MTWFLFAIFSLICFTAYDLLSRKLSVDSANPRALAVLFNFLVAIMSPMLLLLEPLHAISLPPMVILFSLGSFVAWTLFSRAEFYAHKYVEASTLSIILKLAPALTLIYGVIFFGESFGAAKLFGITLIILSNIYLIWVTEGRGFKINKGLIFALVVAVCLSVGWTFDKIVSPYFGLVAFTFISFSIPTVVNCSIPPLSIKVLLAELSRTSWRLIVLAFVLTLAYAFLIKSLMLGETSRVTPMATSTTPLVVLLSMVFLQERDHLWTKLTVAAVTVVGIFLLS